MFRFWSSDPRGSEKIMQLDQPMLHYSKPLQPWVSSGTVLQSQTSQPLKPRRDSTVAITSHKDGAFSAAKRPRTCDDVGEGEPTKRLKTMPTALVKESTSPFSATTVKPDLERAKEAIEQQFSLEILLKHDELRLINQELAKCQVALEQLRRCHLIPYPVNVPTPEQMLNITNGSGPALQSNPSDTLPRWAPPFGVTDGPYARHYAKWLIPDPKFDGIQPEVLTHSEPSRLRTTLDGRSTRNNFTDPNTPQGKGRPARSTAGQKHQSLSNGYPAPKDKSGPCVLKRSDGKTVKLVCIDCSRENFSSTQGFINHCRIAHKRDYKSHDEAAQRCGHPIEVIEGQPPATEEKPAIQPPSFPGLVHPFARGNALSESEACFSVVRRIQESLDMYRKGQLPNITAIPGARPTPAKAVTPVNARANFVPSMESPHLSRLLQSRGFSDNVSAMVTDAKERVDLDDMMSEEEDEEEVDTPAANGNQKSSGQSASRPAMRIPAKATMSPAVAATRPSSNKGLTPSAPYATPIPTPVPRVSSCPEPVMVLDDMMDAELSPNTAVSNNAPSLVSDDGEYDDSVADSDSESEANDSIGAPSMSDVEEMELDDRDLRHHGGTTGAGAGTAVRLRNDDSKHVTFLSSVTERGNVNQKRGR
ncbi:hypothetical protein F4778DRAFT_166794 [Xylariomycetidae sp. FL2044]|nr:hypothetical protein F4778DRAFT_166794 [Xylariomycetidae sp. FL2044]